MFRWLILAVLLALAGGEAEARMHAPYRGHRIVPGATAPLNGFTTPTGAYGFRLLRTAYLGTGPAIRLRRASDNLEADIGFDAGNNWDNASAVSHCAATSCFARTWYDQSGNARHLQQAGAVSQPALIFNCVGALPCLRFTGGNQYLVAAGNFTPATGQVSFSVVARRTVVGDGFPGFALDNGTTGNRLQAGSSGTWNVVGTSALVVAGTEGVLHAANGVVNGASSVAGVDGTEVSGTTGAANVTAGLFGLAGGGTTSVSEEVEVVIWDNYLLVAGERSSLRLNQKGYWGTP